MRKVVKRTAALFMAGMLAFSVAGCGGEKESKVETKAETKAEEETKAAEKTTPAAEVSEETKKEAETTALSEAAQEALKYKSDKAPEEWKIAVVVKDSTNTWFTYMEDGVNEFAEKYKLNAFQKGPSSTDAALQIQVVQDLIAQEVDAICVVPIDPASLEPVLQEAMDAGIVVITHEASSQKSTLFDLESVTEKGYGEAIMEVLAEAMSGAGVYTTMCGLLTNVSHNAHLDAGVELAKEKYPGMTLLEACPRVECEDDSETAYEAAKELFENLSGIKRHHVCMFASSFWSGKGDRGTWS